MAPDDRPPRLQPPPRARHRTDARESTGGPRAAAIRRTGIALLLGTLTVALIGVFGVLPRRAATRPPAAGSRMAVAGDTIGSGGAITPRPDLERSDARTVTLPTPPVRPEDAEPPGRRERTRATTPSTAPPNEAAFVAAMSLGLQALEVGRWDAAREAFETASSLRPNDPGAADGLARATAAERRALVNAGIRRGLELETSEAWAEAEDAYLQVLAVEPEAAGALEGRDRAADRAAIDERLRYHIRNPGRLSSPGVFEDAVELLAEARELDPRGPRLADQLSRLERSLEVASTPVPVVVVSDDLTEIVIYRVDRLGTVSRRELRLRPGTYTAVGSRDGYRDVRVQFTVTAEAAPAPVTVVCTEKL